MHHMRTHTLLQNRKTEKVEMIKTISKTCRLKRQNETNSSHKNVFISLIRTPAASNKGGPCATTMADDKPRKSAAPTQKKNSIFIHGTLFKT